MVEIFGPFNSLFSQTGQGEVFATLSRRPAASVEVNTSNSEA
jgi:hypothetical protein